MDSAFVTCFFDATDKKKQKENNGVGMLYCLWGDFDSDRCGLSDD
jgi:hypothetical protein